jgi:hypothetical protein
VLDAYPDWQIPAHVITTVPTADRQKATVLVRIGFDASSASASGGAAARKEQSRLDPRILPDMGVKVTFLREEETASDNGAAQAATLVPKAALKTEGATTYVFVVANGVAERRAVKTGGADGDRVEVVAGVTAGERVVLSPPAELASGMKVEGR